MFGTPNNTFGGFGNTNQQSQPPPSGGLFGAQANTGFNAFGQPQQQQPTATPFSQPQTTGFGTANAFGNPTPNTGFGANPAPTNAFGQPQPNTSNIFGTASPAQPTASTAFGGFGGTPTPAPAASTFGAFGAPTTANNTGTGLFGQKPAGTNAFGAPTTTFGNNAFGLNSSSAFGAVATSSSINNGTGNPPYAPVTLAENESTPSQKSTFNSIVAIDAYKNYSFEELRFQDYQQGRKTAVATNSVGPGLAGQPQTAPQSGAFGTFNNNVQASPFGQQPQNNVFGSNSTPSNAFGAPATTGNNLFGQPAPGNPSLFGSNQVAPNPGPFGSSATQPSGAFAGSNPFSGTSNPSPFGAQASKPGGLFGAGTPGTSFGATATSSPSNTNVFGAASTPQQSNLFGANNNQNAPSAGGLFGGNNSNNQAPGGLFGANNNQSNAPKPGGLFGATTGTPSLFGQQAQPSTTTNPAFGFGQSNAQQQQQPQPQSSGLFGNNQQQPNPSGGLFANSNTNQQPQTGAPGSLFGNPTPNNSTGNSFGANAPAGGLFGNTNNSNTLSNGLFGNKPNATGSLFGNAGIANQNQTSGFGNSASAGMFGPMQNSNSLLPNSGNLFGASNTSQPFNLSNNSNGPFNPHQNQQTLLYPKIDQDVYGKNPLFANNGISLGSKPAVPIKKQLPTIDFKPLPRPNTKITKLRGFARSASPAKSAINAAALTSSSASISPTVVSRSSAYGQSAEEPLLSPKAFLVRPSPKKLTIDPSTLLNLFRNRSTTLNGSPTPGKTTPPGQDHPKNIQASFDPEAEVSAQEALLKTVHPPAGALPVAADSRSSSLTPITAKLLPSAAAPLTSLSTHSKFRSTDLDGVNNRAIMEDEVVVTTKEKAKIGDYWTCPAVDELCLMNRSDLKAVPNFTAGRIGYGHIQFREDVDMCGIPDLRQDLCGGVLVFRQAICSVYPEDPSDKPPAGQGLNVPAVITLENCWALDKATRAPIKDPNNARVKQFSRRLERSADTTFIEYDAVTGKWTFTVEHFTTYGIDTSAESSYDSEEDIEDIEDSMIPSHTSDESPFDDESTSATGSKPLKRLLHPYRRPHSCLGTGEEDAPPRTMLFDHEELDARGKMDNIFDTIDEVDAVTDDGSTASVTGSDDIRSSPKQVSKKRGRKGSYPEPALEGKDSGELSQNWKNPTAIESRKVAIMQASLFAPSDLKPLPIKSRPHARSKSPVTLTLGGNKTPHPGPKQLTGIVQAPSSLRTSLQKPHPSKIRFFPRIPLDDSWVHHRESSLVDAYLSLGRSFGVSWIAQTDKLVHLGSGAVGNLPQSSGRTCSFSELAISKIHTTAFEPATEIESAELLLQVQLENSTISLQGDMPQVLINPDLRFRHFHKCYAKTARTNDSNIWRLCSVLFDELDLGITLRFSPELIQKITRLRREDGFSAWLQQVVAPAVEQDIRSSSRQVAHGAGHLANIFKLLTGNQVERACKAAIQAGNYRLAILLAQCGRSDPAFKSDVRQQTIAWRELRVDAHIDRDLRKVYELVAGNVTHSKGFGRKGLQADYSEDIMIAEELDWKRSLGLHFWFAESASNFWHAAKTYEDAFQHERAAPPPLPWYVERLPGNDAGVINQWKPDSKYPAYDAIFHIIKFYVDSTYPLEAVLEPLGFGPSPYDYRMPWHLYMLFSRVMRLGDFEDRDIIMGDMDEDIAIAESNSSTADMMTCQYADQLTRLGLCKWAVFVLLHLESPSCREHAIRSYLNRNIQLFDPKTESFITDVLKIPSSWLFAARAALAHYKCDFYGEYKWLVKAGRYTDAHHLAVAELAPEAVIKSDLTFLTKLFDKLPHDSVAGWPLGGKVFLDYIRVMKRLPHLVKSNAPVDSGSEVLLLLDYVLPNLLREVPFMFKNFPRWNSSTMKQQVCVKEMMSGLTSSSTSISLLINHHKASHFVTSMDLPHADKLLWTQKHATSAFMNALKRADAKGQDAS